MEVPEERGSKEIKVDGQDTDFILGESRAFPIEDILFSDKVLKCFLLVSLVAMDNLH